MKTIIALLALLWTVVGPARAGDDQLIYSSQLNNGWQDWGWVPHSFTNSVTPPGTTGPTPPGTNMICVTPSSGWQALYLEHDPFDTTIYTNLTLWINGGPAGGQSVGVNALVGPNSGNRVSVGLNGRLPTNSWLQVNIPLSSLGAAGTTNLVALQIWSTTGNVQSNFYVADISLAAAAAPPVVHVGLSAGQTVRTVPANLNGLNQVAWDGNVDTPTSVSLMNDLGNPCLRWPGGSWGDGYHWTNEYRGWGSYSSNFIHLATNTHAQAFIIVNYGSSTPQEAVYGVRMFNATNHCAFKYWEVGNECFGSWETDYNTNAPWRPYDAWTYAMRFTNYYAQMKAADPTILVGCPVLPDETSYANYTNHPAINPVTGTTNYGWTAVLLATLHSLGVTPDFVVEHKYAPGDGDTYNLLYTRTWSSDALTLRKIVTDYLGPASTNITLECTENGPQSDRQWISLVGGLYYADTYGQIMQTEFKSKLWWDTRNGPSDVTNSDPALYGWRKDVNGYYLTDGGVVYNLGAPTNRYPSYYTGKLLTRFAAGGDSVVTVTNDYELLGTYAVKRTNGALALLVINKSSASNLTARINLDGFTPATNALLYSYGISQDTAAQTVPGTAAADVQTNSLFVAGPVFTNTFGPYSASVIVLSPVPVLTQPQRISTNVLFQLQGQAGSSYVLQSCTSLLSGWTSYATSTLSGTVLTLTNPATAPRKFWRVRLAP